ncbi:hypothetical protein BRADI_3g11846v3 [Brachypodium distachyon]|uniref:Protein FAR1-RELATED SEQUENCE n=1 Tax=Brachypodium distachyon TaxID=15368 RepID=A0A2K2CWQ2_BRADI|nr:hypothetical protein BRADI_3g11846v3 [Brachypodium distachyon]
MQRPDLPDYLLPKINMQFNTTDEAFSFYNRYARHAGFGLRKGQNDGRRSYLYCSRQGRHKFGGHETERIRDKTTKRTGCLARLRLKLRNDGTCFIADVTYDHNHQLDLSAPMVVFLRSHKNFDPHEMQLVEQLKKSNAPHGSIMSFLASMHGGHHNLPHNSRDIHNRKEDNVWKATEHDLFRLLAFFHEMKSVNKNFFYEIKIDEIESISHIFRANASSRGAYEDFNDCVTFDTTYKTNKFRMPLGVFVGVNNHLQSTIFAIALLRDETIESFQWVFSTFLRCINGKHPICILTDQCPSMAEAIPTVLPDTLHKLRRWHVVKKYRDDLVKIYAQQPAFKDKLHSILNWPLMPTEFEDAWAGLMNKYSLQEDEKHWRSYTVNRPGGFQLISRMFPVL